MFTKNQILVTLLVLATSCSINAMRNDFLGLSSGNFTLNSGTGQNQTIPTLNKASQDLFDAIQKGDAQGVESALNEGADINAYNQSGRTPFGWLLYAQYNPYADYIGSVKKDTVTTLKIATLLLANKDLNINKADGVMGDSASPIIFELIEKGDSLKFELLKRILKNPNIDLTVKKRGISPLELALQQLKFVKDHDQSNIKWADKIVTLLEKKTSSSKEKTELTSKSDDISGTYDLSLYE